jgi:hypothetical protein
MSATSVTGKGYGSARRDNGPDGGKRAKYVPLTAPHVVAAGHVVTVDSEGSDYWQQRVTFPTVLPGNPHDYVVMTQQDDYSNNDGRNQYPAHIEKLNALGENEDDSDGGAFTKDSGFSGFIIHTGDDEERTFMYMVSTTGFLNK